MDAHDELLSQILIRMSGDRKVTNGCSAARGLDRGLQGGMAAAALPTAMAAPPRFPYSEAKEAGTYWFWFRRAIGRRVRARAILVDSSPDVILREPTFEGLRKTCAEVLGLFLSEAEVVHLQHSPVSAQWLRQVLSESEKVS
mmetsp:Transcript_14666/g.32183  ORF Transcript_14666/g.32183 Transcript_14666/m.32183 type:complete len:142 (-) Transcript_14666:76-501(-)